MHGVTSRGGLVLFVGTRDGQARAVVKAAEMAKGCHLFDRWIPGSITNGEQILGRCATRVVNELDEPVPGFESQLVDRAVLKPDLVVCLNPLENYVLLHECGLNNIPTIGIIDTDANPTWVTYPIPANDDSLRAVQVIAGVLGRAGEEGRTERLAKARNGGPTFPFAHGLQAPEGEFGESGNSLTRELEHAEHIGKYSGGDPAIEAHLQRFELRNMAADVADMAGFGQKELEELGERVSFDLERINAADPEFEAEDSDKKFEHDQLTGADEELEQFIHTRDRLVKGAEGTKAQAPSDAKTEGTAGSSLKQHAADSTVEAKADEKETRQ